MILLCLDLKKERERGGTHYFLFIVFVPMLKLHVLCTE